MRKEKAKESMIAGKPYINLTEGSETLDKIAGFVGISRSTLKKIKKIVETAEQNPENTNHF